MSADKDTRVYGKLVPHVKKVAKGKMLRTFTASVNFIIEKDKAELKAKLNAEQIKKDLAEQRKALKRGDKVRGREQ